MDINFEDCEYADRDIARKHWEIYAENSSEFEKLAQFMRELAHSQKIELIELNDANNNLYLLFESLESGLIIVAGQI